MKSCGLLRAGMTVTTFPTAPWAGTWLCPGAGSIPASSPGSEHVPSLGLLALLQSTRARGLGAPAAPHVSWEGTLSSAPTLTHLGFSQAAPLYCTKFLLVIPQHHDRRSLLKHTH